MSEKKDITVAFTGHRTYCGEAEKPLQELLQMLYEQGFRRFLTGMAWGFDLAAGEAVMRLKEQHDDIELVAAVPFADAVNVVPQPKAGGSFATAVWQRLEKPVAVEHVKAKAGMDIGATLIGMHLREVAVPLRLSVRQIGQASLVCARTRPKFIGGQRAAYVEELK